MDGGALASAPVPLWSFSVMSGHFLREEITKVSPYAQGRSRVEVGARDVVEKVRKNLLTYILWSSQANHHAQIVCKEPAALAANGATCVDSDFIHSISPGMLDN